MFVVSVLACVVCLVLLFILIYRRANNLSLAFSGCALASLLFFFFLTLVKYDTKYSSVNMDNLLIYSIGIAAVLAVIAVISEVTRLTVNNLNNAYESTEK